MDRSYRFGRFELRPAERELRVDGRPVTLGARAFDLLRVLVERNDRMVSKSELLDLVWPGRVVEEANLPVQVSGLRKLLGARAIATIPGLGYRFAMSLSDARSVPLATTEVEELQSRLNAYRRVTILGFDGVGSARVARVIAREHPGSGPQEAGWIDRELLLVLEGGERVSPALSAASAT